MQVTDEMVRAGALALNARTGGNEARFKHMQEVYMAEARAALTVALAAMWQPIETAPKDGTRILVWFVHAHAKYSDDPIAEGWEAAHEAYWIDHNGGGWTWHGLCGVATRWQPLPAPPEHSVAERNDVKEKGFVHNLAESK